MNPSILDMKLAVARMLPFSVQEYPRSGMFVWRDGEYTHAPVSECPQITDREWLHACWLAEQTLTDLEWALYDSAVCLVEQRNMKRCGRIGVHLHASAETKLEALCRIRHHEMFTE